ncbi:ATP/GTP-binding protein [Kineococcus gypseus]
MLTWARQALAAASLALTAGLALAPAGHAAAPAGGGAVECENGQCRVVVTTPGNAGSSRPGTGGGGRKTIQPVGQRKAPTIPDDPTGQRVRTVECSTVPGYSCLVADDGTDFFTNLPYTPPADAAPGAAPAPVIIDPAQVAALAVARLQIQAPDVQLVPKPEPGGFGFIGLPVWLWTPQAQWQPISATASIAGVTVTATAQLSTIDFDMGDGAVVRCESPGLPYQASFGDRDSPTCGHRYSKTSAHEPNQEYTITATANYDVTWAGAATGSTTLDATSNTALAMGERQILVTVG